MVVNFAQIGTLSGWGQEERVIYSVGCVHQALGKQSNCLQVDSAGNLQVPVREAGGVCYGNNRLDALQEVPIFRRPPKTSGGTPRDSLALSEAPEELGVFINFAHIISELQQKQDTVGLGSWARFFVHAVLGFIGGFGLFLRVSWSAQVSDAAVFFPEAGSNPFHSVGSSAVQTR